MSDPDVPRHIKRAVRPRQKRWGIEQWRPYTQKWWYASEEDRDEAFATLVEKIDRWDRDKQDRSIAKYRKVER